MQISSSESPAEIVSAYLPAAEAALLRKRADEADRSTSAELRRAVRRYLKDKDAAARPAGTAA